MLKYRSSKKGVQPFSQNGSDILLCFKDKYATLNDAKIYSSDLECLGRFINPNLIFVGTTEEMMFYNINSKTSKLINNKDKNIFIVDTFNNRDNTILICKNRKLFEGRYPYNYYDYYMKNLQDDSEVNLNLNQQYPVLIYNDLYFFTDSVATVEIYRFKDNQFSHIWTYKSYDLGFWRDLMTNSREDYEIKHWIGVISGVLWLGINAGIILGIDVETGEANHILKMPSPKQSDFKEKGYESLFGTNRPVYDKATNKLVGINSWHYYEIDLNKSDIVLELFYFKEECVKHQVIAWHTDKRCVDAQYVYFADAHAGKLAALNRQTLEIDWTYQFTGKEAERIGIPNIMEVTDTHLYVLDHLGNLFIFEKEGKE